jgi:hypothetical protein
MGFVNWANRVEQRYAGRISSMFGGAPVNANFVAGLPSNESSWGGAAAFTEGHTVYLNPSWFKNNKDTGAIIHELGHVMDAGSAYNTPAQKSHQEAISDALRYALTGHDYGNLGNTWNPSAAALAVYNHRGWGDMAGKGNTPGNYTGNKPRANRNTVGNGGYSPGTPAMESPSQAIQAGADMANVNYSYAQALAKIAAQRGALKAQFLQSNQQARQAEIGQMAGAVEQGIAQGFGSQDIKNRAGVQATMQNALAQNRSDFLQGRLGLATQLADARNQMYQSQYSILAMQAAYRAQAQLDAFNNGSTMAPQGSQPGQGGVGGGGGGGYPAPDNSNYVDYSRRPGIWRPGMRG